MKIEPDSRLYRLMDRLFELHLERRYGHTRGDEILSRICMLPLLFLTASYHGENARELVKGTYLHWSLRVINLNLARRAGFRVYAKFAAFHKERIDRLNTLVKRMGEDLEKAGGCQEQWNSDCMSCLNASMCARIDSIAEFYQHSDEPVPDYTPDWY